MAPKTGPSLKELMKNRNKVPSPQDKNKSRPPANSPPPPPQIPADLGLKPNSDLRRKRPVDTVKEGELGPSKGNKQARQTQDHRSRSRRSNSVDNREEPPVAQVRRSPCTWSPVLEVNGMPIAFDATLRHYREGHVGLLADALQQPLLLPQDMAAYRSFNHPDLFLSLKKDLAMVSNSAHFSFIYVYLHFITEATLSLHILGHATSFCGRGMGQKLSQGDKGCPGCPRYRRGLARCTKR